MSKLKSAMRMLSGNSLIRTSPYINGKWVESSKTFPVLSPTTREVLYDVGEVDSSHVTSAINAAENAFISWREVDCKQRSAYLHKLFRNVESHKEELAHIMTAECGKPITGTRIEVSYAASFLDWFAGEAKRTRGDVLPEFNKASMGLVLKQPVGVVGLITPWNHPLATVTRKVGAALAAGCTLVLKPSEETPLTALAFAAIAEEIGLPPGVLNVLPCSRSATSMVGEMLCESRSISKISFTGSTAVGKLLLRQSADTVKRVSMELGGNSPFVVFDTADLDTVMKSVKYAKFKANGQACIAANRFIVQKGIYDRFMAKIRESVESLMVGDPFDDATEVSGLINEKGLEKVEGHVADATDKGCATIIGASTHPFGPTYYKPTILADCSRDMLVMTNETFGPVIPVMRFSNEKEAVDIMNDTRLGLAGYIFSQDMSQVIRVAKKMQTGMVGVNESAIMNETIPFGGIKESGIGREGSHYGINDYLETKYVCIGGL